MGGRAAEGVDIHLRTKGNAAVDVGGKNRLKSRQTC